MESRFRLKDLLGRWKPGSSGGVGAVLGLALGLSLILFGILRTLFLILLTVVGYIVGRRFFGDRQALMDLLDRILPPGKFR